MFSQAEVPCNHNTTHSLIIFRPKKIALRGRLVARDKIQFGLSANFPWHDGEPTLGPIVEGVRPRTDPMESERHHGGTQNVVDFLLRTIGRVFSKKIARHLREIIESKEPIDYIEQRALADRATNLFTFSFGQDCWISAVEPHA